MVPAEVTNHIKGVDQHFYKAIALNHPSMIRAARSDGSRHLLMLAHKAGGLSE